MKKSLISLAILSTFVTQAQITKELLIAQRILESGNSHYTIEGNIITSTAGAIGIAQFMPNTWEWLLVTKRIPHHFDIADEQHQKHAQWIYMRYLYLADYGIITDKTVLAVAAYNAGINRVRLIIKMYGVDWRQHLPKETIDYLYKLNI